MHEAPTAHAQPGAAQAARRDGHYGDGVRRMGVKSPESKSMESAYVRAKCLNCGTFYIAPVCAYNSNGLCAGCRE